MSVLIEMVLQRVCPSAHSIAFKDAATVFILVSALIYLFMVWRRPAARSPPNPDIKKKRSTATDRKFGGMQRFRLADHTNENESGSRRTSNVLSLRRIRIGMYIRPSRFHTGRLDMGRKFYGPLGR